LETLQKGMIFLEIGKHSTKEYLLTAFKVLNTEYVDLQLAPLVQYKQQFVS
jgi:hypothetical protein